LIGQHETENRSGPGEEADLEKAIEIKRRAQRCILNGDLDGALNEYEKLVATGDSDPYHSVLLADLLYKKGDHDGATRRYFEAVDGYERMSLFKNAIAVCKKMSRLSLSAETVIRRLGKLHALDGLATESTLYYMQHAELILRRKDLRQAMDSFREAFQICPDNVKALERLGDVQAQSGAIEEAAQSLVDAANHFDRLGQLMDAKRCRTRAEELVPGISTLPAAPAAEPEADLEPEADAPAEEGAGGMPVLRVPDAKPAAAATSGRDGDTGTLELVSSSLLTPGAPYAPPVSDRSIDLETTSLAAAHAPAQDDPAMEPPDSAAELADPETEEDAAEEPGQDPADAAPVADAAADAASGALGAAAGLPEVSMLLQEAQALFERGERDAASATLVRAAQAYDRLGRFDSAASIYRSLSRVTEAPLQVMMLWLKNCQRRDDRTEGARVACELGDRALIDGDTAGAREWFERARAFDDRNEVAARRLERLNQGNGPASPAAPASAAPAAGAPPAAEQAAPVADARTGAPARPAPATPGASRRGDDPGIIEVSYHQDGPVDLDLGGLIAEFQKGLESQLASDPQGHYDLAMSYREMGLFDEALLSFQLAAQDPKLCVRATELIGRCLLDRGDFDEAATQLQRAIAMPGLDADATLELVLQLGLALEAGGRVREALQQFERIYAEEPSFPDVAQKIRALRKALEKN
jgi:tetratricopeptide (TPR) repeat protein